MNLTGCTCNLAQGSIGLDLGATYSGVAVVHFTKCEIHPERHLDPPSIRWARKFPTILRRNPRTQRFELSREPSDLDDDPSYTDDDDMLRLFKLSLVDKSERYDLRDTPEGREIVERMMGRIPAQENTPDLVSIVLKGLVDRAPTPRGSSMVWHAVVTWPYYWHDKSGSLEILKEAVKLAGISVPHLREVTYVTEHEAALRSILHSQRDQVLPLLEAGHSIIVVDCGGMTVDAVVYQPDDPLGVTGGIKPRSRLCGGLVLDEMFHQRLIEKVVQATKKQESEFSAALKRSVEEAMHRWHTRIKRNYNPQTLDEGSASFRMQRRTILITRNEMIGMFDKVAHQIADIIHDLFLSSVKRGRDRKCIFLTGGFSIRPRLIFALKTQVSRLLHSHGCPEFILADQSWEAVARGAALWAAPQGGPLGGARLE